MKRNISIVTGSRSEYDLLKPLIQLFQADDDFHLQLIVSAMHLSEEFGFTKAVIDADQFPITETIEMLLNANTASAVAKSIGIGVMSFADAWKRLQPDLMLILGDRFEALSAVVSAFIMQIPVIHLHGGETTVGAFDEGIRHAVTKMSYLHFTSTEEYRKRVIQLGEAPERVFNVGAVGVENIKKMQIISKAELENQLGFKFKKQNILVTYHPVTLETNTKNELNHLLMVLNKHKDLGIIFTKANADTEGRWINQRIDDFVSQHSNRAIALTSMGQFKYLNTMRYVDAVVGNSSSGIIEAPSLKIGSINIGDRQTGRAKSNSVVDCVGDEAGIEQALLLVLSDTFKAKLADVINPYDGGATSKKIYEIIKDYPFQSLSLKKNFYDVSFQT